MCVLHVCKYTGSLRKNAMLLTVHNISKHIIKIQLSFTDQNIKSNTLQLINCGHHIDPMMTIPSSHDIPQSLLICRLDRCVRGITASELLSKA